MLLKNYFIVTFIWYLLGNLLVPRYVPTPYAIETFTGMQVVQTRQSGQFERCHALKLTSPSIKTCRLASIFSHLVGITHERHVILIYSWIELVYISLPWKWMTKNRTEVIASRVDVFIDEASFDRRLLRYTHQIFTTDKVISYWQFSATVLCIMTLYVLTLVLAGPSIGCLVACRLHVVYLRRTEDPKQ